MKGERKSVEGRAKEEPGRATPEARENTRGEGQGVRGLGKGLGHWLVCTGGDRLSPLRTPRGTGPLVTPPLHNSQRPSTRKSNAPGVLCLELPCHLGGETAGCWHGRAGSGAAPVTNIGR